MEPWAQEGLSLWPPTARKPPPFSQGQGTPFSAFHPPSSPNRAALISSILIPRTVHPGPLVGLGMAGVGQWSGKVGSGQHTPSFFPPMGAGKEGLYSFSGNLQLGKED